MLQVPGPAQLLNLKCPDMAKMQNSEMSLSTAPDLSASQDALSFSNASSAMRSEPSATLPAETAATPSVAHATGALQLQPPFFGLELCHVAGKSSLPDCHWMPLGRPQEGMTLKVGRDWQLELFKEWLPEDAAKSISRTIFEVKWNAAEQQAELQALGSSPVWTGGQLLSRGSAPVPLPHGAEVSLYTLSGSPQLALRLRFLLSWEGEVAPSIAPETAALHASLTLDSSSWSLDCCFALDCCLDNLPGKAKRLPLPIERLPLKVGREHQPDFFNALLGVDVAEQWVQPTHFIIDRTERPGVFSITMAGTRPLYVDSIQVLPGEPKAFLPSQTLALTREQEAEQDEAFNQILQFCLAWQPTPDVRVRRESQALRKRREKSRGRRATSIPASVRFGWAQVCEFEKEAPSTELGCCFVKPGLDHKDPTPQTRTLQPPRHQPTPVNRRRAASAPSFHMLFEEPSLVERKVFHTNLLPHRDDPVVMPFQVVAPQEPMMQPHSEPSTSSQHHPDRSQSSAATRANPALTGPGGVLHVLACNVADALNLWNWEVGPSSNTVHELLLGTVPAAGQAQQE